VARDGSRTEAVLFVYLAELLFCLCDQLLKAALGQIIHRLPHKQAVLHDLHFEFHSLVF
jgi:hypothetical protein